MEAQSFIMFSNSHVVTLIIIISIAFIFPAIIKNKSHEEKLLVAKILGCSAICLELINHSYGIMLWISLGLD